MVTYFVAMPFLALEGGLTPGQAMECPTEAAAVRHAEAMARSASNAGAIAFSRRGDPSLGEFEDAVVIKTFGEVPDEFCYG
jgi:hypothetical protein